MGNWKCKGKTNIWKEENKIKFSIGWICFITCENSHLSSLGMCVVSTGSVTNDLWTRYFASCLCKAKVNEDLELIELWSQIQKYLPHTFSLNSCYKMHALHYYHLFFTHPTRLLKFGCGHSSLQTTTSLKQKPLLLIVP